MEPRLEDKIEKICQDWGIQDPLSFTAQLMSGSDPRYLSRIYEQTVELVKRRGDRAPTKSQWLDLVDIIRKDYCHIPVPISVSSRAAEKLLEFTHGNKKQVEVTNPDKEKYPELTEEEMTSFMKIFKENF